MIVSRSGLSVTAPMGVQLRVLPDQREKLKVVTHAVAVRIEIKTKSLLPVVLDPAHQALIDRILGMHAEGLDTRQISDRLNAEGVLSARGKTYYPAMVFGVIRKARLRAQALLMAKDQMVVSGVLVKLPPRLRGA